MHDDPIVNEIRKRREDHAARFDFNVRAIAEDAQNRRQKSGGKVVVPPRRQPTE